MHFGFAYIAVILAGLAAMAWGFPAAHRLKRPLDLGAALVALGGVIAFVLGTLLTIIPGFFRG
jgi:hypothetical protein